MGQPLSLYGNLPFFSSWVMAPLEIFTRAGLPTRGPHGFLDRGLHFPICSGPAPPVFLSSKRQEGSVVLALLWAGAGVPSQYDRPCPRSLPGWRGGSPRNKYGRSLCCMGEIHPDQRDALKPRTSLLAPGRAGASEAALPIRNTVRAT